MNAIALCVLLFSGMASANWAMAQEIDFPEYMPARIGSERIWFIPGWQHSRLPVGKYNALLKDTFQEKAFVYSWNAGGTWEEAQKEITQEAGRLARKISHCPERQRKNMLLVGHSLGARMILEASQTLIDNNVKVKCVVFLGGAVPFDDPRLKNIERISDESPVNIFDREDGVLRTLFAHRESNLACGYAGIGIPTSFRQFEVPNPNPSKRSLKSTIKDASNHAASQYLKTLKMVLKGKHAECVTPSLETINAILGRAGLNSADSKTPFPAVVSISILEKTAHWEYGMFSISTIPVYVIFDPYGRLVFSGEKNETENAWQRIRKESATP